MAKLKHLAPVIVSAAWIVVGCIATPAPGQSIPALSAVELSVLQQLRQDGDNPAVPESSSSAAPQLAYPQVLLTTEHQALCKLGVGDLLPEITASDLAGNQRSLRENFGSRGAITVLLSDKTYVDRAILADLIARWKAPAEGISLTIFAVGAWDDDARKRLATGSLRQHVLLDPLGEHFAPFGTEALPRIYASDPRGRIVWFDIEYSEATRRELDEVLRILTADQQSVTE